MQWAARLFHLQRIPKDVIRRTRRPDTSVWTLPGAQLSTTAVGHMSGNGTKSESGEDKSTFESPERDTSLANPNPYPARHTLSHGQPGFPRNPMESGGSMRDYSARRVADEAHQRRLSTRHTPTGYGSIQTDSISGDRATVDLNGRCNGNGIRSCDWPSRHPPGGRICQHLFALTAAANVRTIFALPLAPAICLPRRKAVTSGHNILVE